MSVSGKCRFLAGNGYQRNARATRKDFVLMQTRWRYQLIKDFFPLGLSGSKSHLRTFLSIGSNMKCGNFKFCQITPFLFKVHNFVGCILQLKRNIRGVFISVIRRDLQFQQAPPFVYSYILVWESGCSPICNDSEFFPLWSFQNFRDAHFSNKETMLISSLTGYFCLLYISVNLLSNSNAFFLISA